VREMRHEKSPAKDASGSNRRKIEDDRVQECPVAHAVRKIGMLINSAKAWESLPIDRRTHRRRRVGNQAREDNDRHRFLSVSSMLQMTNDTGNSSTGDKRSVQRDAENHSERVNLAPSNSASETDIVRG
jgi:hypothetical protein